MSVGRRRTSIRTRTASRSPSAEASARSRSADQPSRTFPDLPGRPGPSARMWSRSPTSGSAAVSAPGRSGPASRGRSPELGLSRDREQEAGRIEERQAEERPADPQPEREERDDGEDQED